ncbi:MAG TPA: GIY-YIG nuclease family protein [Metalysinibacillus jejuensis]|jgi:putative endonuclease|uniref:GIY-YIG nuclease family protein n=1 Tax=Metalysinibacillus jejuensis TaxID=914327 RepID=A0A921T4N1_9BACL|nr:GIY-YIG nuclease family protein [Metalysinibacillus jejuensis]HJH10129.1 GIY-YIG nuclease family protein [Metalysinibacillus jejuensis]
MVSKYHYFYVVRCKDNSLYAGYTTDLCRRVRQHNNGQGAKYTRARRPVALMYFEVYATKQDAMKKEYAFKQLTRKNKLQYMRGE